MPPDPRVTQPVVGLGSHHRTTTSSDEWYTPKHIFDALGIEFDLDPCSPALPAAAWVPASRRISLPDDGLSATWDGRVWLNPPYGRQIGQWVRRLARHGDGVALVFARTDTGWFQDAARVAGAICFLERRLQFVPAIDGQLGNSVTGAAGAPSVLMGFGSCSSAVQRCGLGMAFEVRSGHAITDPMSLWEAEDAA